MAKQGEFDLGERVVLIDNKVVLGACVWCGAPIRHTTPLPLTPILYFKDVPGLIPCAENTLRKYIKEGDQLGWLSTPIYRKVDGGAGKTMRVFRSYEVQALRNRMLYVRNPTWQRDYKQDQVRQYINMFELFGHEPGLIYDDPITKGSDFHAKEVAARPSGQSHSAASGAAS